MMNYRLTYYGLSGFDYAGFDTIQELHSFVERQSKLGILTPLKTMRYNKQKDEYY